MSGYNKWKDEEDYKLREKERQEKIKQLDEDAKLTLDKARETNEGLAKIAAEYKTAGENEITAKVELIKTGGIDLAAQKKAQEDSISLKNEFFTAEGEASAEHYAAMEEARQEAAGREYSLMEAANIEILDMLKSCTPQWFNIGMTLMDSLVTGLQAQMSSLQSVVARIRSMLDSISVGSMEVPVYGYGGIVTQPHMAVVGDVPEAIIPLNQLYDVLLPNLPMTAAMADSMANAGKVNTVEKVAPVYNYTVNINQPEKSPAEMAREIKRISRALARECGYY